MPAIFDKFTSGGIPYTLMAGYPKIICEPNKITGTEKYQLDWSNLVALGIEYMRYGSVGTFLPLPMQMPGFPGLYCNKIELEPFIDDLPGEHNIVLSSGQEWKNYCVAVLSYSTIEPRETQGNVEFSRATTLGGQFIELSTISANWENPDVNGITAVREANVRIGKFEPTFDHTFSIERLTSVPWNTMRSLIGRVNNATLLGAPAETIMFSGAELRAKTTMSGTTYQLDYKVSERPTNWNKFYRETSGAYEYVTWNGNKAYLLGDLSQLFL